MKYNIEKKSYLEFNF